MGLHDANVEFLRLSHLRRDGVNPKVLIQAQKDDKERLRNNTIKKLVLDWYEGYVEKISNAPNPSKNKSMVILFLCLVIRSLIH